MGSWSGYGMRLETEAFLKAKCVFSLTKSLKNLQNQVTAQENTARPGQCVLCSLTVAKHQEPYTHNPNDGHWSPQTTGRVCLHILIGLGLALGRVHQHVCTNARAVYQSTRTGLS